MLDITGDRCVLLFSSLCFFKTQGIKLNVYIPIYLSSRHKYWASCKTACCGTSLEKCLRERERNPEELGIGFSNCRGVKAWRTLRAAARHTYIGEDKFTADKSRVTLRLLRLAGRHCMCHLNTHKSILLAGCFGKGKVGYVCSSNTSSLFLPFRL
jgi:hypothetical protein